MNKYSIPDGMLEAATGGVRQLWDARYAAWNPSEDKSSIAFAACLAAIVWLSENPIVPTSQQVLEVRRACGERHDSLVEEAKPLFAEWQRRMFLAPEPEVPGKVDEEKERFRAALEELAKLGNGPHYGNSDGNRIAQKALRVGWDAPKDETAYGRVTHAMGAVTLSREEGEHIIEYVKGAIHG